MTSRAHHFECPQNRRRQTPLHERVAQLTDERERLWAQIVRPQQHIRELEFGQATTGLGRAGPPTALSRAERRRLGWVVLEAGGELFGVVEDFLGGSGHGGHLRYFGRAGMAWTMIGPSALSMTPTFEQVAGGVGADEHREVVVEVVDDNRVVEGLDHVVVADAVLPSARRDQRRIHDLEVNLRCDEEQVTLRRAAEGRFLRSGEWHAGRQDEFELGPPNRQWVLRLDLLFDQANPPRRKPGADRSVRYERVTPVHLSRHRRRRCHQPDRATRRAPGRCQPQTLERQLDRARSQISVTHPNHSDAARPPNPFQLLLSAKTYKASISAGVTSPTVTDPMWW